MNMFVIMRRSSPEIRPLFTADVGRVESEVIPGYTLHTEDQYKGTLSPVTTVISKLLF